ncbi:hypothetical protein LAUMK41_01236 [Mycobacterium attenuatum]|nr:hypothetical protein LAUMK41_01236 [Mycobacterium attenuatum]
MAAAAPQRTVESSSFEKEAERNPTVKNQTKSNRGLNDEAGALSRDHRKRPHSRRYTPKRYSFLEDSCMSRAMYRL